MIVICHCLTSRKTTKKPLIFFYHRLKPQVLSFIFRYIMHLRFCISGQKIRAISIAFLGSFFARILILIIKFFSRFYLKNRTTIEPTPKSLFFNDFNARRGIATPNNNSMVNDGNSSVQSTKERTFRATLFMPNSAFFTAQCLTLYQACYIIT